MSNPYQVVQDFETALCAYTGARYAVTTTSCTMALLLALSWWKTVDAGETISLPKRTYIGVPMTVLNAGYKIHFRDHTWRGRYYLETSPVCDSARRFTGGMFLPGTLQCVSFHWTKVLSIGQGGAILHDSNKADPWLRRARFDGRTEGVPSPDDKLTSRGYHAYMAPRDAAEGLSRLAVLPQENADLPWDDYPDLSELEIFK